MSHRKLIWRQFKTAGILDSQDARVQEFVQYLQTNPAKCWAEIIPEFREKFYDCFDTIVPRLAEINDPLIQTVLVNNVDASKPKEAALLEKMAGEVDSDKNPVALKRIAGLKIPSVSRALKRRTLPEGIMKYVTGG
jgi:hypothetical protein